MIDNREAAALALELFADTLEHADRTAIRALPGYDLSDPASRVQQSTLLGTASKARFVASVFRKADSFEVEIEKARRKMADMDQKTAAEIGASMEERMGFDPTKMDSDAVVNAIKEALKSAGVKDKLEPDGEDPQAVIERVFAEPLSNTPTSVTALRFGRVKDNRAYGLYTGKNEAEVEQWAVLVACAGDAHITPASDVFESLSDAEAYIASDFDPLLSSYAIKNPKEARAFFTDIASSGKGPTIH